MLMAVMDSASGGGAEQKKGGGPSLWPCGGATPAFHHLHAGSLCRRGKRACCLVHTPVASGLVPSAGAGAPVLPSLWL